MKESKKKFTKDFTKLKSICTKLVTAMIALEVYNQIVEPKLIELSKKTE